MSHIHLSSYLVKRAGAGSLATVPTPSGPETNSQEHWLAGLQRTGQNMLPVSLLHMSLLNQADVGGNRLKPQYDHDMDARAGVMAGTPTGTALGTVPPLRPGPPASMGAGMTFAPDWRDFKPKALR